ncbi:hypothetical protein D3C71_1614840 [compost metagenome]
MPLLKRSPVQKVYASCAIELGVEKYVRQYCFCIAMPEATLFSSLNLKVQKNSSK